MVADGDSVGRLFVAVALSEEVRHGLAAHLHGALEAKPVPGKPVRPESWHLTLRFLGRTSVVAYDRVLARLHETDLGAPFRLAFDGLGAFPRPARATVLWLGVEAGGERLAELAEAAENAAVAAGFPPEERPFHPHLTLSRIRPHQDVRPVLERVSTFPLGQQVDEVVVYRSHLGGGPARYEALERFVLST